MKNISHPFTGDFKKDVNNLESRLNKIVNRLDPNHKHGRAKACLKILNQFGAFHEINLESTENNNSFNAVCGTDSAFGKWISKEKPEYLPKYVKFLHKHSISEYNHALINLDREINRLINDTSSTNNQKKCIKLLEKFFSNFAERLGSDESSRNNFLNKFGVGSEFGKWMIANKGEAKTRYLDFLANKVKDEFREINNSRSNHYMQELDKAFGERDRKRALDNFNNLSISILDSLKYNINFQKDFNLKYKDVLDSIEKYYGIDTEFGKWMVAEDKKANSTEYKNILDYIQSNAPQTEPKQVFSIKKTTQNFFNNFFTFKAKCQEINKPSNEEDETPSPPTPKR